MTPEQQQKLVETTRVLDGHTMAHFYIMRQAQAKLNMAERREAAGHTDPYMTEARKAACEKQVAEATNAIEQAVIGYMVRRTDILSAGADPQLIRAIKSAIVKEES